MLVSGVFLVERIRASAYKEGVSAAEKACEEQKQHAIQEALMYRDKDEIGVRRISMDDVVHLLSNRGELRD